MQEYLLDLIKLGVPLMLLSWWLYSALYRKKLIDKHASRKDTKRAVKNYRKDLKQSENSKKATLADTAFNGDDTADDFWLAKILRFGGGFYGLTALWTFIVLEVKGAWQLVVGLPAFIENFSGGIFELLMLFIKNQFLNFTRAFTWIVQWADGFSIAVIVFAYLGYLAGMNLAKRWDAKEVFLKLLHRR